MAQREEIWIERISIEKSESGETPWGDFRRNSNAMTVCPPDGRIVCVLAISMHSLVLGGGTKQNPGMDAKAELL